MFDRLVPQFGGGGNATISAVPVQHFAALHLEACDASPAGYRARAVGRSSLDSKFAAVCTASSSRPHRETTIIRIHRCAIESSPHNYFLTRIHISIRVLTSGTPGEAFTPRSKFIVVVNLYCQRLAPDSCKHSLSLSSPIFIVNVTARLVFVVDKQTQRGR
jgi:hypothetical protein